MEPVEGRAEGPAVSEANGSGTQALDRAVQLVESVVQAEQPRSFADLQGASGLAKSTTSRMLSALERGGLLERDETGGYVAGRLFSVYAARHDPWEDLVRLAGPTMAAVGEETLETVHLSVLRGHQVVQVAQVDSRYLLGTRDWTQIDVPAHSSALGKVFYAWGGLEVPDELEQLTPSTITDPTRLRTEAAATRRRGYAVTTDELEVGLTGIAVPVSGPHDDVVAALGISGPTARLAPRRGEIGRRLAAQALQLAAELRGIHQSQQAPTMKAQTVQEGVA
jgi:DNA-binding IclR family transcriptional regulator